jgi:rubrerythrin
VPERRPLEKQNRSYEVAEKKPETAAVLAEKATVIKKKLWYCKQCGYVVYREDPPYVCPICKAKREMFSELLLGIS